MNRRNVLQTLALAPVALAVSRIGFAAEPAKAAGGTLPPLTGKEPLAQALQYVPVASQAKTRSDKTANCSNCQKFNKCAASNSACKPVAKGAAQAPCELFADNSVAKDGWCMSWAKA